MRSIRLIAQMLQHREDCCCTGAIPINQYESTLNSTVLDADAMVALHAATMAAMHCGSAGHCSNGDSFTSRRGVALRFSQVTEVTQKLYVESLEG